MINRKPATGNKQEVEKFVVRLPMGMRDRIAEVARLSRRSMNSEIVARLEQTLGESWTSENTADHQSWSSGTPILRAVDPAGQAGEDLETRLLQAFRSLSKEKQQALLEMLS